MTRGPLPASHAVLLVSCITVLSLVLAAAPEFAGAADRTNSPAVSERALINLLRSNAPPAAKAMACKQLAIYGTRDAVPALAPLLSDKQLASWSRIALEAIPGSAPDAALRRALNKVQGKLLVGVINSIAVRRDSKAVNGLVNKLKHTDPEVASAAAAALGRIGGAKAAKTLSQSLAVAPAAVRPAVAEGCILCAEWFIAQAKPAEAVKLYDAVRAANVPRQNQLEAIRGGILARQSAGLPLLLEQLRSLDKDLFGIGLRTARELPGREVTEALAAEVQRARPERQAYLLLALGDRSDAAVMPAVLAAAANGARELRLTAVGILDRLGNPSSLPVLLEVAADPDADLAKAALGALARLPGNEVDAGVLARLPAASGKARQVLIELAGQRHFDRALPLIVPSAEDRDAGVRAAAVQAIGTLGDEQQVAGLVRLLQSTQSPKDRADIEMALLAICSRTGTRAAPPLLPLAQSGDSALRCTALRLLASAGGPDALGAVQAAVEDQDETVQDEAVRTLSTWPNNWPEDSGVAQPLLTLARSAGKTKHQVLASRGYLQYIQGNKQLPADDKISKVTELLPLIKRPDEKRLAIAAIGGIPTPAALELLVGFAAEPAIAEDACSAVVKLADGAMPGVSQEQRQKALQLVAQTSTSDATRKKAGELLKASQ
ncbi:MAG TPA: HEAT repeat domain-containing protein [Verrucomicrobiota bacterium]|nr:HEAT repeat domain-containing protein [Verrucomicrobiota bacterium]